MKIETFANETELDKRKVIDKCIYLAYYLKVFEERDQLELEEMADIFEQLHYPRPNISRLKSSFTQSRSMIKGTLPSQYKLHSKTIKKLDKEFPNLSEKNEEIISDDIIIPESLYTGTRGFVESLARQINASYESNLFDGCAVLMRRLLEILLILSYENLGIKSDIQQKDGSYMLLNGIVNSAKFHDKLGLSRNTRESLEDFKAVGNFSAHKIYYNAKRKDISKVLLNYRATVEELLYKSGIKK